MQRPKTPAIAAAMVRLGRGNKTLAKQSGIHPVTMSRILNMRCSVKPDTVERLARALESSPQALGLEVWERGQDDE